MMTPDDKTAAAHMIKSRVNWARFPKLAAVFQHRPPENIYWHELVDFLVGYLEWPDEDAAKKHSSTESKP